MIYLLKPGHSDQELIPFVRNQGLFERVKASGLNNRKRFHLNKMDLFRLIQSWIFHVAETGLDFLQMESKIHLNQMTFSFRISSKVVNEKLEQCNSTINRFFFKKCCIFKFYFL